jgi:hypothetical protein
MNPLIQLLTCSTPARSLALVLGAAALAVCADGRAATAEEAAQLKTTLTPVGGERAGNKDGTIPEWKGGLTTPTPGFKNGGRRPDPFAAEKPLYSVTAKNMDAYEDKLSDGAKALLKKFPDTYRLDVYPTHRTAAAPQRVYDNIFRNATSARIVNGAAGPQPSGAWGGIPFPIPKTGVEVMWNHLLYWRPDSFYLKFKGYLGQADGRWVNVLEASNDQYTPYYLKDSTEEKARGEYGMVRSVNSGPPIRAGEAITGRFGLDQDKAQTWVYLTGQRRVRKLPNACCDTPTPFSAGVVSFDEVAVFLGRLDRFDWKLVGKKELLIPYNGNRTLVPTKDADVLGSRHLNPDHVRWELHRVWVVEATLREGQRHVVSKSRYYVDEDTWIAVLGDRWDAKGQLWRTLFTLPFATPDVPGVAQGSWGTYDLIAGTAFVNVLFNDQSEQYKIAPTPFADALFTADGLAADGVR